MKKSIALLLLFFTLDANASIKASGLFEATESCPAFISKNKKTNPHQLKIQPHQLYQLVEINQRPATWLRIELNDLHHSLRWVNADCGVVYAQQHQDLGSCDVSVGKADSNLLALSSQAGFCQIYGYEAGKPECLKLSKTSYDANHLTLHGLWPNQEACGQQYGYCGVKPRKNHCDYSSLDLSDSIRNNLLILMPSFRYGSCLERHEWNKHGSCQSLTMDEYFGLALRLTNEVNNSIFGQFLTEHNGEVVQLDTLRDSIVKAFGKENNGKIYLGCKNGILVDVFINLPALITFGESLNTLINDAPNYRYRDKCPSRVKLSNFNKSSLNGY